MAEIAPLTPLRYDLRTSSLAKVVAPPYDVIDAAQRAELAARDPHNVVRLILPEGEGDAKYAHARALFAEWSAQGVFVREESPAFFRYDQTFAPPAGLAGSKLTRRGFFALVRLRPFSERVILPHERTLSGPKEDRLKLFRATRTKFSPGFMLYRDPENTLAEALETAHELASFSTDDGVDHRLAKIDDPAAIRTIIDQIARSSLLIADGHHRYETALRYADDIDAEHAASPPPGRGRHHYFMAFLSNGDDPNLVVFPTHRHVHSLPALDWPALLAKAAATFQVESIEPEAASQAGALLARLKAADARAPSIVAAMPDGRAALFTLRGDVDLASHPTLGRTHEALRTTDVALLHMGLLEHVLGITREAQAAKTNLWYPQDGEAALAALRGGKGQILFLMNPTPVAHVRRVAEAGEVMPQKSTFFYPKIATGLCIHTLEPDVEV
jgi:uncharacterized protein (DUF1015 family)